MDLNIVWAKEEGYPILNTLNTDPDARWGEDPAVKSLIELAKAEDLGDGDLTSALMSAPDAPARCQLIAKQAGVFAGRPLASAILNAYDSAIQIDWAPGAVDGVAMSDLPHLLATLRGPLRSILSAERILLNFLQRLSGIATMTRRFVDAVASTRAKICDTRKTTPGWRRLEKYAVRCGGGTSHRAGLHDAVLIKDNHLHGIAPERLAGEVFQMLNRLASLPVKPIFVEVEADTLSQVEPLFTIVGIDIVLLDNFSLEDLRQAVRLRDDLGLRGKVELEASGGVTLQTVRAIAETGVERISAGALTHSAPALDLSLERID